MSPLPLIDFSVAYTGTQADRAELAATITEQLRKHGAMRLINTSIKAETIQEGFKWVSLAFTNFSRVTSTDKPTSAQGKKFFSLPTSVKEAIPNERNADPQRGWSYVGSENTSKLDMTENEGLEDEKVSPTIS